MLASDEYYNEQRFFFAIAALMFLAVPIRFSNPEAHSQREFRNFITTLNLTHHGNSSDYEKRIQKFKHTSEVLEDYRNDNRPVFGINRYKDLSQNVYGVPNTSRQRRNVLAALYRYTDSRPGSLPQHVDWRRRGIITPIRNPEMCGACIFHSVIATIDAMQALKWNTTATDGLSVRQIMACSAISDASFKTGDTCHLLGWLQSRNITIFPERHYHPLVPCHMPTPHPPESRTARVTDYTCSSFVGQEPKMLSHLALKGPLIASVSALPANHDVGGVITRDCSGPRRHAVQIIGYDLGGQEEPHFIVRYAWGSGSGRRGYAKIAIGGNVCGIAERVSTVTVD